MADLAFTASNVVATEDVRMAIVQPGHACTQGQSLYKGLADGKYYKSVVHDIAATARCDAIALTAGVVGQPMVVALPEYGGMIKFGVALSAGKVYVVSTTAGGIRPIDDVSIDEYITVIGIAVPSGGADHLLLKPIHSGVLSGNPVL